MNNDPRQDPRWLRLHDRPWTCSGCGGEHSGLFDLTCSAPDQWKTAEGDSATSESTNTDNKLSDDLCMIDGEHFFVRCVLDLPIVGVPEGRFGFGVWSTLSRKNFASYVQTFESDLQGHLGPWFGWLSNRLHGYPDTLNLKCQVHPRDGRVRPWIELEPTDHPLAVEQRQGITFDRILELYSLSGHDFRRSLTD